MILWELITQIGWRDVVDILVVSVFIYWILLLLRGTRSLEILLGLSFLILAFLVAQRWGLVTIHWILSNFIESIIIFIIVIFQDDIRRALSTMGKTPFLGARFPPYSPLLIEEVVEASVAMARLKLGALIVLEREADVKEHVDVGVELDARVSRELLLSIFNRGSPLHDGAVLVQRGRVSAARCFLPLSENPRVSRLLGTRHRAALGISERTDAVVIVVSEERGSISLAIKGKLTRNLEMGRLRTVLSNLLIVERSRRGC
ncbi:MAG: TIGR00159 family protein [Deltaproteobacteria bacterium]|nr:MAG: TIGR00159 family protein [Deltaproteobacteria bacterium]